MPVNGYSVGKDVSLDITSPAGPVRWKVRTGWSAKPKHGDIEVKRLDGVVDHLYLPQGWLLNFDLERQGPELDAYFATAEANYYAGLNNGTISVTETITEPNGAVSQFRYTNVVLKPDDLGDWKGDGTVKQKVSGMASRRIKVA